MASRRTKVANPDVVSMATASVATRVTRPWMVRPEVVRMATAVPASAEPRRERTRSNKLTRRGNGNEP